MVFWRRQLDFDLPVHASGMIEILTDFDEAILSHCE